MVCRPPRIYSDCHQRQWCISSIHPSFGKVTFGSFPHRFKKDRPILSQKIISEQLRHNGICTTHPKDHITQIFVGGLYIGDGSYGFDYKLTS